MALTMKALLVLCAIALSGCADDCTFLGPTEARWVAWWQNDPPLAPVALSFDEAGWSVRDGTAVHPTNSTVTAHWIKYGNTAQVVISAANTSVETDGEAKAILEPLASFAASRLVEALGPPSDGGVYAGGKRHCGVI